MRYLYLFILSITLSAVSAQQLKQIERGTAPNQIPVTNRVINGVPHIQVYRDAVPYILDTISLRDTILALAGSLDSCCVDSIYMSNDTIFLRDGLGFAKIPQGQTITSVTYGSDTLNITTNLGTFKTEILAGGGMDSLYNGDRPISRVPTVGQNLGATTFRQWLDWWYIGNATAPTLTMNTISPTLVEVGTSNAYTLSGTLTNSCGYTIGTRLVDGTSWSGSSYSKSVTFAPTSATTQTYSASAAWTNTGSICAPGGASSGTATASRATQSVYPVLWGMSATSYTSGSVPYSIWSKKAPMQGEGNHTGLTMTGSFQYIYILIPKSWSDFTVSTIKDHNDFDVTSSFTAYDVTVTSTGLVNNWTQNYKLYKLNNVTSASGFNYTYNR